MLPGPAHLCMCVALGVCVLTLQRDRTLSKGKTPGLIAFRNRALGSITVIEQMLNRHATAEIVAILVSNNYLKVSEHPRENAPGTNT